MKEPLGRHDLNQAILNQALADEMDDERHNPNFNFHQSPSTLKLIPYASSSRIHELSLPLRRNSNTTPTHLDLLFRDAIQPLNEEEGKTREYKRIFHEKLAEKLSGL